MGWQRPAGRAYARALTAGGRDPQQLLWGLALQGRPSELPTRAGPAMPPPPPPVPPSRGRRADPPPAPQVAAAPPAAPTSRPREAGHGGSGPTGARRPFFVRGWWRPQRRRRYSSGPDSKKRGRAPTRPVCVGGRDPRAVGGASVGGGRRGRVRRRHGSEAGRPTDGGSVPRPPRWARYRAAARGGAVAVRHVGGLDLESRRPSKFSAVGAAANVQTPRRARAPRAVAAPLTRGRPSPWNHTPCGGGPTGWAGQRPGGARQRTAGAAPPSVGLPAGSNAGHVDIILNLSTDTELKVSHTFGHTELEVSHSDTLS